MMNKPQPELSERDVELLSAYLDEMLSEAERQELEARLPQEAPLRDELLALRQTMRLVTDLPTLKAPRDFRLKPEQVGVPPQIGHSVPAPPNDVANGGLAGGDAGLRAGGRAFPAVTDEYGSNAARCVGGGPPWPVRRLRLRRR